jgi:hypothetical protein
VSEWRVFSVRVFCALLVRSTDPRRRGCVPSLQFDVAVSLATKLCESPDQPLSASEFDVMIVSLVDHHEARHAVAMLALAHQRNMLLSAPTFAAVVKACVVDGAADALPAVFDHAVKLGRLREYRHRHTVVTALAMPAAAPYLPQLVTSVGKYKAVGPSLTAANTLLAVAVKVRLRPHRLVTCTSRRSVGVCVIVWLCGCVVVWLCGCGDVQTGMFSLAKKVWDRLAEARIQPDCAAFTAVSDIHVTDSLPRDHNHSHTRVHACGRSLTHITIASSPALVAPRS